MPHKDEIALIGACYAQFPAQREIHQSLLADKLCRYRQSLLGKTEVLPLHTLNSSDVLGAFVQ
ncbi:hypothetical protein D3C80_1250340 [compost metagenome]